MDSDVDDHACYCMDCGEMPATWVLKQLKERLEKADATLKAMVKGRVSERGFEATRLEGKAEGVRLAQDYVREMLVQYGIRAT